jgi:acetyl esterase
VVLDLQAAPERLHAVEDIELPGPAGAMTARVYLPRPGRLQTILYLHGGGFVIGPEGYDAPLRQLAVASGCLIVALRCRLAPEHRFPAALEDALAGARWLAENVRAVGGREVPIGLAGDSSGGNLAAVVARTSPQEGIPLAFQVLLYPMLDATASSPSYDEFASGYGFSREKSLWYFDQYLPPEVDRRAPRVSPLFERHLSGLPPTLIVTAECDPLRDEGERYAHKLREAGVDVEVRRYRGMIQGFFQMTAALRSALRLAGSVADEPVPDAGTKHRAADSLASGAAEAGPPVREAYRRSPGICLACELAFQACERERLGEAQAPVGWPWARQRMRVPRSSARR